ncbi:MAG: hypothetical protein M3301_08925 [Chloroflexota bacterium]|nr:hypothetical protein [Chloroflexota bacterium]
MNNVVETKASEATPQGTADPQEQPKEPEIDNDSDEGRSDPLEEIGNRSHPFADTSSS